MNQPSKKYKIEQISKPNIVKNLMAAAQYIRNDII